MILCVYTAEIIFKRYISLELQPAIELSVVDRLRSQVQSEVRVSSVLPRQFARRYTQYQEIFSGQVLLILCSTQTL